MRFLKYVFVHVSNVKRLASSLHITQKIERGGYSIPSWDSSTESLGQLVKMKYNVYNDPN
jgi:hypothetical protein